LSSHVLANHSKFFNKRNKENSEHWALDEGTKTKRRKLSVGYLVIDKTINFMAFVVIHPASTLIHVAQLTFVKILPFSYHILCSIGIMKLEYGIK
jgi:hypothetical protein